MLSSLLLLSFCSSLLNVLLVKILLSVFRCVLMSFSLNFSFEVYCWLHSHKKRKDSLESSLYWVLFAAELNFLKILVPNLSQHTSNVNIYRKIRMVKATVLFIWDKFLAALIHLFFYSDINLFLITDTWCKLCNMRLLLCENRFRSFIILELHTGGKYYCSYYSNEANRWQFKKTS